MGFAESSNPIGQNLEQVREMKKEERFMPKRAAVLVCLFEDDDGNLRVILTKRSSKLSTHSGEVALPGGKAEEGDKDDMETATREAKEEIGLDPSLHLLKVIPVVGILSDKDAFKPVANVAEVETVFDAPLEISEEREWMGYKYLVHYFDHEADNKKYVIWGLTAAILIRAAAVVYQRPPPFLEQNPKFKLLRIADKNTVLR
ncbi:Nudix hydrolase 15 mitochondrial [Bienertia sinuspersici]